MDISGVTPGASREWLWHPGHQGRRGWSRFLNPLRFHSTVRLLSKRIRARRRVGRFKHMYSPRSPPTLTRTSVVSPRVCLCCFVLLNRYWGIVTVPGLHRVNRPQILTWGLPDPRVTARVVPAPLAIEKIGDWKNLEILVQNQSFWNIVGARPTAVPRNSGRDDAAGILIIWWTSPPRSLQIHSLH